MDDTQQGVHNPHQMIKNVPAQPPVPTVPPQAIRPVQPPGISGSKEHEPNAVAPVEAPVEAFVKPAEQAPEISKELRDIGVEQSVEVKAQEEPVKIEVAAAPAQTVIAPPTVSQQLTAQADMTVEQATEKVKHASIGDSVRWFAAALLRQLKIVQQTIKS